MKKEISVEFTKDELLHITLKHSGLGSCLCARFEPIMRGQHDEEMVGLRVLFTEAPPC
jgi:hypothetical protein